MGLLMEKAINQAIYAGVLGKVIGVYLGRPVEGWSYKRIQEEFGLINRYVHNEVGDEIVEPDDDISGTFTFVNVLKDLAIDDLSAKDIGDFWLNELIEYKTIFWWGGMFRATEHTAYLRLKAGIDAPKSGSYLLNGKICAEQIGAQIFIDSWALISLDDPYQAKRLAKMAACVSHDLVAVKIASFIAVLECVVYQEKNIKTALIDTLNIINDSYLTELVNEIIAVCEENDNWRLVRDYIEIHHGYHRYQGNCPIVTNFLAIIMALMYSNDDFLTAISIAVSCGWDTDCNAGNVGCIEGIRLGVENIMRNETLKSAFNEKIFVVNAEGGHCLQDVTSIANSLIAIREGKQQEYKYSFNFYDSTCAFNKENLKLYGAYRKVDSAGLYLELDKTNSLIYREVYHHNQNNNFGYKLVQAPSVYPGQTLEVAILKLDENKVLASFFVEYIGADEELVTISSEEYNLKADNVLSWRIPAMRGYPIVRIGLKFTNLNFSKLIINYFTYYGNPSITFVDTFSMSPNYLTGRKTPSWYNSFITNTLDSSIDHLSTFCISSAIENGLLYIGTRDWYDYKVSCKMIPVRFKQGGLIGRMMGLNKYYALIIKGDEVCIIKRVNKVIFILAKEIISCQEYDEVYLELEFNEDEITAKYNEITLKCFDEELTCGAAGFLVDEGMFMAKDLIYLKNTVHSQ